MSTPRGIRIPVSSVKGRCPRPLDDGGRESLFVVLTKIIKYLEDFVNFQGQQETFNTGAEVGFEPTALRLWALRATRLLYSAIIFVFYKNLTKSDRFCQPARIFSNKLFSDLKISLRLKGLIALTPKLCYIFLRH